MIPMLVIKMILMFAIKMTIDDNIASDQDDRDHDASDQDDQNTEGFRTSVYTSHRSGVWNVFLLLLVCIRQTAKSSPLLLLCIVLSDIQTIRQTD